MLLSIGSQPFGPKPAVAPATFHSHDLGPELCLMPERRFCGELYDHGRMTMIETTRTMKTIAAGEFKVHCLAIMDEVQSKREAVVITKRGKPVAKLVPVVGKEKDDIYGFFIGRAKILGDVVAPAFSREEWGDLD